MGFSVDSHMDSQVTFFLMVQKIIAAVVAVLDDNYNTT